MDLARGRWHALPGRAAPSAKRHRPLAAAAAAAPAWRTPRPTRAAATRSGGEAAASGAQFLLPIESAAWRVRPLDTETRARQAPAWLNDEVRRVAALQAEAFLRPPPDGPAGALLAPLLAPLARASFSAEVLDALRGKTRGVSEGSFAVLVAERRRQTQGDDDDGRRGPGDGGSGAAGGVAGGGGGGGGARDDGCGVVGVVELRAAADADVLAALRKGGSAEALARRAAAAVALAVATTAPAGADQHKGAAAAAAAAAAAQGRRGTESTDADADADADAHLPPPPPSMLPPMLSVLEGDDAPLPFGDDDDDVGGVRKGLRPLSPPRGEGGASASSSLRRVGYFASMAVDPSARRSGAARAMLGAAEALAACWGLGVLALHVYADNAGALSLYGGQGWREVEREPAWVAWVPGKRPRVLMAKRVGVAARRAAAGAAAAAARAEAAPAADGAEAVGGAGTGEEDAGAAAAAAAA